MPTIMDVAKLAGVSHGTVSNVLRGSKSVKLENVIRVKNAMKELGYQPDLSAQTLKSSSTNNVAIILPDLKDNLYTSFFTSASEALRSLNYNVSFYVTGNLASVERDVIRKEISSKCAGLIILTCQPHNTEFFETILKSDTKVVFLERAVDNLNCNTVFCENKKSIQDVVTLLFKQTYRKIGLILGPSIYTSEQLCLEGYKNALEDYGIPYDSSLVCYTDFSDVSAFNACMHLFHQHPDTIICSSTQITDGVMEALRRGATLPLPKIITLSEESWADNRYPNVDRIPRNSLELGIRTAELLHSNILDGKFSEIRHISIPNGTYKSASSRILPANIRCDRPIRIAVIEGETADSLRFLMPDFIRKTGINVIIDGYSQEELYELINKEVARSYYDVFDVDVMWFKEFASRGMLRDLTNDLSEEDFKALNIQDELQDDFMYYEKKIYGIPFMYCSPLLFYRTDLFENTTYSRMFYEMYKQDLAIPQNWTEFNAVARFFTKSYNPDSPTEYGTTLGGHFSCAALCEFLPRLWANGGDVFDKSGNVILDSFEAKHALLNYCESFLYAPPNSTENWWDEQVEQFINGDTAMMIMYSSYVSRIADPNQSQIIGKYGFTEIPGKNPILGGWSFAVNEKSTNAENALKFILWACGRDLSVPNTILGNLSASRSVFENSEIYMLYPWIRKSLEVYPTCKRRFLPENKSHASMQTYEQIVAKAVHNSITGHDSIESALTKASKELSEL